MELDIKPKAVKDLDELSKDDRNHILDKIEDYLNGATSSVKKLTKHKPNYRLRVGNYRALFDIDNNTMIVRRVLHRKDAYKK